MNREGDRLAGEMGLQANLQGVCNKILNRLTT